jgi:hypothetical protein
VLPAVADRDEVVEKVEAAGLPVEERDGSPLVHDPSGNAFVLVVA